MSLYYLILWNQVDILQIYLKEDHAHMGLWTRLYDMRNPYSTLMLPCWVIWLKLNHITITIITFTPIVTYHSNLKNVSTGFLWNSVWHTNFFWSPFEHWSSPHHSTSTCQLTHHDLQAIPFWAAFHETCQSLTTVISYWNPCIWLAETKFVSEKHSQNTWWNRAK